MSQDIEVSIQSPLPKDWSMEPHCHPAYYEVALVRNGSCLITHPLEKRLKKNNVFCVPHGVSHGFACNPPTGVQFVVLHFQRLRSDLVGDLINDDTIDIFRFTEVEATRFLEISFGLQREVNSTLPYSSHLSDLLLHELIVLILRANKRNNHHVLPKEQEELVEDAIKWMHEHCCDESLTIEDAVKRAGLSSSYFRKVFKQVVGSSPKRYLTQLRLQASKRLMMESAVTITEVALRSGFNSPQQFSKTFRQYTGLTPSEWQRNNIVVLDTER
ncbi:MAG TPA: helix-turn-helix domain-containing protein [Firmicutes bacterium]|jgi:AraC-like DNA-binding protein|nr:helix-turn-helix domain-containing protein [Bacillota bacterium]